MIHAPVGASGPLSRICLTSALDKEQSAIGLCSCGGNPVSGSSSAEYWNRMVSGSISLQAANGGETSGQELKTAAPRRPRAGGVGSARDGEVGWFLLARFHKQDRSRSEN